MNILYSELGIITLFIVALFMVGAAIIISAKQLKRNYQELSGELWKLYGIEFFIVAAVLVPAYLGGIFFIILLLLFNIRAHVEIAHLHGYMDKIYILITGIILSSALILAVSYIFPDYLITVYLSILIVTVVLLATYILVINRYKKTVSALLPMTIFLLSAACLLQIRSMENGFLLIIFLYIVTETNDAFALVAGKLFGRNRMCPGISPNKTWEGLVSGALISMLVGLGFSRYVLNYTLTDAGIIVGLIIASAIIGDLVFSIYKRAHNTKDFMTLIKGHGGIIDIYDSLLISSITFYALIQLTGSSSTL